MATQPDVSALALAEAARRTQAAAQRELTADVIKTWPVLDLQRLAKTWPAWLHVMTQLLLRYHAQSADDAALFYRATRQLELGDPGDAVLADPPAEQWLERAFGFSAPGVFEQRQRAGDSPERAERTALTRTLGTAQRIMLDGSRTTVEESAKADSENVGWLYVTDGDPCYFCAMIASRGVVFQHDSFVLSNARFIGKGTAKVHNGCGCIAAPAFDKSMTLPALSQEAQHVYRNRGEGDALNAFRRAWESRPRAATKAA